MNHVLGNANASTASPLLKAIRDTSASGHFKLWMADPDEQEALIATGLIDDKASGELSADSQVPEAGIYLSELQQGKQDWYLKTSTTVTKTCGDVSASQNALYSGVLDKRITTAVRNTQLGQFTEDQLGDEYTVTFTMKNTLTKAKAESLPDFVNGGSENPVLGGMLYRVVLTAPYGGEITAVQADIDSWGTNTASLYDRQYIMFNQQWIEPGKELTIAYTVRVSSDATHPLNVVTTPVVNADGVETGSNGKVTDECPADTNAPMVRTTTRTAARTAARTTRIRARPPIPRPAWTLGQAEEPDQLPGRSEVPGGIHVMTMPDSVSDAAGKPRDVNYDLLRVVAMCLVIGVHVINNYMPVKMTLAGGAEVVRFVLFALFMVCNPLLIMVSGRFNLTFDVNKPSTDKSSSHGSSRTRATITSASSR